MKSKHLIPLIGLGLLAIVGTVGGLGLAGAFGSDVAPTPARASVSSRTAPPGPAPATTTTPHQVRASGPGELPADVTVEPDRDFESALRSAAG